MPNFIQNGHLLILCLFIIVVSQTILDERVLIIMNLFLVFIGLALIWTIMKNAGTSNIFGSWAFAAVGIAALFVGLSEVLINFAVVDMQLLPAVETMGTIGLSLAMIMCGLQSLQILKETRFR